MKSTNKTKPLKIHIGLTGGVRIDSDEFFARPSVKEKMEKMEKMDIVGKTLDGIEKQSDDPA